MKNIVRTFIKCVCFFFGWAIMTAVLNLSISENPAIWRLWAEITPLLTMIIFTFLFWLIEKKEVALYLFRHPIKGILAGMATGILWLGIPVLILMAMNIIEINGINHIPLLPVWMLAAFLNVIMQELLMKGYLYQMLKQKYHIVPAVIVTTVLFTLLHGGALEAGTIPTMNVLTMSLLMTVLLEYSGSILAPVLAHFLWNGIGAVLLGGVSLADDYPHLFQMTFSGNDLLSGGVCKIEGSIVVFIVNCIFIFVFLLLMKKQKHSYNKERVRVKGIIKSW